jgi:HlyD family secretion protein
MKSTRYVLPLLLLPVLACNRQAESADAYGNFEAVEVLVSAETSGRIISFSMQEGATLQREQVVAIIDSTQLYLQKLRLESGFASLGSNISTLDAQVHTSQVQVENLEREKRRIDALAEGGAATTKQQDDMNGQLALLVAQMEATESQKASLFAERKTLEVQISQVEDQIRKCSVRSPIDGVLLSKYREQGEVAAAGQPLCKTANLKELILRAYVSGNQLSSIRIGGEVTVLSDSESGLAQTRGVVSWISPSAEFTPKIIQTREERVNLVYAIKVVVPNDGNLKIGMPGEVLF